MKVTCIIVLENLGHVIAILDAKNKNVAEFELVHLGWSECQLIKLAVNECTADLISSPIDLK